MKKTIYFIVAGLVIFSLAGCASFLRFDKSKPAGPKLFQALPPYSGPKARIAVTDFEITATKATAEAASELRRILIEGLSGSNRFEILQNSGSGNLQPDLVISVSLVQFEPCVSGGKSGIGGGGGVTSGRLGGLLGSSLNKAYLSLKVRILNPLDSKDVSTPMQLKGQASDSSEQGLSSMLGNINLGKGLASYKNTPMEQAIVICITETIKYISGNIPPSYYKYQEKAQNGKT